MSKNDVAIKELLQKVEEQKAGLGKKEKVSWLTNCVFKKDGANWFNINTITDFSILASALGFLISQEECFQKACKRLGVTGEFKWDGYTLSDWEEDFKTRVRVVQWDNKNKVLENTKKKLGTLVSEEVKTEMELEDIKKILGE